MKSKKARKQRKAQYNAPAHARRKMVASHLSDSLMEEYGRRSIPVIRGDTVMIMRGSEDKVGTEGKVTEVDTRTGRITIEGITTYQADGTEIAMPVHASNVVVTKLDLSDAWRKDKLESEEGAE